MKNLRSRSFLFVFFLTLFLLAFAWLSSTPVRIQGFESIQKYEDREVLYQQFSLLYLIVTTPLILLMVFSVVQYSIGKWLFDKIYLMYRQLPRYFFSWICPIAFIIFSALTAFRIMGATPRILDGFNYLFQAQNMALGQFTANIPPVPEFFQFVFIMMQDGRWYGSVYPGFPLILALGVLIRAPWLVNPVLGGIGIHLTFRAGKAFFNTETAKLTVLLMTFSPFYRMMASIFMSHISAMIGSLVAIWMIWIWITKRNFQGISVPFAAGTAMGYVYITRPQAGMVVIPFIIYAIVVFLKRSVKMFCSRMKNPFENQMSWHRISVAILFLLLPMIGSFLFLSFYNLQVTGEAFVNPRYLVDPQRSLGFGDSLGEPLPGGLRSGHSLGKGIHNISVLLRLWNSDLLGWGSAGLLGIPIILVILCFGDREFFTLKILLGVGMLFVLSLYLFYYTPSPNFGPRYLTEIIPSSIFLAVLGLRFLWRKFQQPDSHLNAFHHGLTFFVILLFAASWIVYYPVYLGHYGLLPEVMKKSSLPMVPGDDRVIYVIPSDSYKMNVFTWNSPNLDGNIYVRDLGSEKISRLQRAFPSYRVLLVKGLTGSQKPYMEAFTSDHERGYLKEVP